MSKPTKAHPMRHEVNLTTEQSERWQEAAYQLRVSMGDVIRQALVEWLDKYEPKEQPK